MVATAYELASFLRVSASEGIVAARSLINFFRSSLVLAPRICAAAARQTADNECFGMRGITFCMNWWFMQGRSSLRVASLQYHSDMAIRNCAGIRLR